MAQRHQDPVHARAILRRQETEAVFAAWLAAEAQTIEDCACWLGGPDWGGRAVMLTDAIRSGAELGELRREIAALRRLFALELTEDLASPEALHFAGLDMDDARVFECCAVLEALTRGLALLAAAPVRRAA